MTCRRHCCLRRTVELILRNRSSKGSPSPTGDISCSFFASKSIRFRRFGDLRPDVQGAIRLFADRCPQVRFGPRFRANRILHTDSEPSGRVWSGSGTKMTFLLYRLPTHRGCHAVSHRLKKDPGHVAKRGSQARLIHITTVPVS